jgi:hypothetical protein
MWHFTENEMKTKYFLFLIAFILLLNFQGIKRQVEKSLFSKTVELKTEKEVNDWLKQKNFFEWTSMKFEQAPNFDIKISINFDDLKDKFAGDKFNHWNVQILIKDLPLTYRVSRDWNVKLKKEISLIEFLDTKQRIKDLNKLKAISIRPTGNAYSLYFEDWFGSSSCYIKGVKIEILKDECEVRILKPKLSNTKISFTYLDKDFPNSKFWIDELNKEGVKSSYIEYFLNPVDISEVPEYKYSGWSIRPLIPKSKFPLGLNIDCITENNNQKTVNFDLQEEKLTYLFDKIKIIASKIPLVNVKCGNVLFTKAEWNHYLKTKQILK